MLAGIATTATWTIAACSVAVTTAMGQSLPPLTDGDPAPGARVRRTASSYLGSGIFHAVYLPTNWQPGQKHPVIVEWPPNFFPPGGVSGEVDDSHLGFYLSGGVDFIWVTMPIVAYEENPVVHSPFWWGLSFTPEDPVGQALAADYAVEALQEILESYGGDPAQVFATGFSRGAIATGYIALSTDQIADVWAGFLPHAYTDGIPFTPTNVAARRQRVNGRPSLISWGDDDPDAATSGLESATALTGMGYPVETMEIPGVGHSDDWIVNSSPQRDAMRAWLSQMIASNPGTYAIHGRVADGCGNGIPGVRIESGLTHFTYSDANGDYALDGLPRGARTLLATHADYDMQTPTHHVTLHTSDAFNVNFLATPRAQAWAELPVQLLYATVGASAKLTLKAPCSTQELFVVDGQMPPGLQLDSAARRIVGVPLHSGAYPFTLRVVQDNGATADYCFTMTVFRPAPPGDPAATRQAAPVGTVPPPAATSGKAALTPGARR